MINNSEALSMAESMKYVEKDSEMKAFAKKFVKMKPEEAEKMRDKLKSLDLMKLNEEHISKIIDLMPEQKEELNKIFTDVSLEEDEIKKILETIKEFK